MPRICTVCSHEKRNEIDRGLVQRRSSMRGIAAQYALEPSSVMRHAATHLVRRLVRQAARSGRDRDARLHARVLKLVGHLEQLADSAATAKSAAGLLAAANQLRPTLELLGKVTRELAPETAITVQVGLWQKLGVRDEAEAIALVGRAREVEGLPEPELAERMREWLRRYDAWHEAASPQLPDAQEAPVLARPAPNGGGLVHGIESGGDRGS